VKIFVKILKVESGKRESLEFLLPHRAFLGPHSESLLASKPYDKIFVVGLNRCGTTSFFKVFKQLGLSAYHGENQSIWNYVHTFDSFCDFGVDYEGFKKIQALSYRSCFILNTRPALDWVVSTLMQRLMLSENSFKITEEAIKLLLSKRRTYFKQVLDRSLKTNANICLVNITRKGWGQFVSSWLGFRSISAEKINVTSCREEFKRFRLSRQKPAIVSTVSTVFNQIKSSEEELFFPGSEGLVEQFPRYL